MYIGVSARPRTGFGFECATPSRFGTEKRKMSQLVFQDLELAASQVRTDQEDSIQCANRLWIGYVLVNRNLRTA